MDKPLKDIIEFVSSRTDIVRREDVLREINFAWGEVWNSEDLPNSCFEITIKGDEANTGRLALPFYVGTLRAVKTSSRTRVELNTPRPYYHDDTWAQSPYTWRILGESPLAQSISNATRLKFVLRSPNTKQFKITVIGPDDTAADARDQIIFPVGSKEVWSTRSFTDAATVMKDTMLDQNVSITGANGEDFGFIPNLAFAARNLIVQIYDRCNTCCTSCYCWDVYYKRTPPVLYYDEQLVPYPEALMTKTLEWITLPKEGQEKKTMLWAGKTRDLLNGFNADKGGVKHVLDVSPDRIYTYTGSGSDKI